MPCSCGKSASYRRCKPKNILSGVGPITVPRRYYACRHCKNKQTPWEAWAGVAGPHRITPHARRMIVLAGSGCSFDEASRNLKEIGHLQASDDVVRRVCDAEGKSVQQWMNQSPQPAKAFAAAPGVVEFSTDGLKINTVGVWREIRQSVLSKRVAALPARADQWDDRPLEPPAVRFATCAIAPCGRIGAGWERMIKALGLPRDQALSVIADGAKWIWAQAARAVHRPARAVGGGRVSRAAVPARRGACLGEKAKRWAGERVVELIERGGPEFIEHLRRIGPPSPPSCGSASSSGATGAGESDAWCKLLSYLEDNRDSLWYGQRLEQGLPIGSGLIEGGGKSTLARRLKINSARWRVRRAERMGAIRCLQYSGLWESYWESKHAA